MQKKKSFQIKEISVENEVSTYYDETRANIDSYDYWEMIVWQYGIHGMDVKRSVLAVITAMCIAEMRSLEKTVVL